MSRLIDLDQLDMPGKTIMLKALTKYEKEHPLTEIKLQEKADYTVLLRKDGDDWTVILNRNT